MNSRSFAVAAMAALGLALLPTSSFADFNDGPDGFELSDFNAGAHSPNRGSSLVHSVTALAGGDDTCPGVSLDYGVQQDFTFATHTWTWESPTFTDATTVDLNWLHEGDHARFRASASATITVTGGGATTSLHGGRTVGPFLRAGDAVVSVAAGQTILVTVTGKHFDRARNQIIGSLELRPNTCEALNADPVCDEAFASDDSLWPPNHSAHAIHVLGVTDPDGDEVTILIDSIFQDEPVNGTGGGSTDPDGSGIDTDTAEVLAERDGAGNGRVYHIGFSAFDGLGGTCAGEVLVDVPRSQGRNGAAVDDGALFDSTNP